MRPVGGMVAELPGDAGARPEVLPSVRQIDEARGRENFPVALFLLSGRHRRMLHAIYRFARLVDHAGDEAQADRLALLDHIERDLRRSAAGEMCGHPAVAEAGALVSRDGLPLQPMLDLIEANRRDQRIRRYPTWEDLLEYCRFSANPVGRLVLAVFGVATAQREAWADLVCSALQVLEHCQDVGEDARRGRIYLPQEDLRRCQCREDELLASTTSPSLRCVLALLVTRARELLAAGRPLIASLRGRPRMAVAGYVAGSLATADALESANFDVLGRPVRARPGRVIVRFLALLAGRGESARRVG